VTHDFDVIIVGAGLSGIGAAYHLKTECPTKSFAVLEARDTSGGTWDLFRYPGIRSDSDMFTLGYPFNPWKAPKSIADGPAILAYIRETSATFGIDPHIRFGHRIVGARWSSADARWMLDVEVGAERRPETYRCSFFYVCAGYYRYDTAYNPEFRDVDRFRGTIVHPQWWPRDLDYKAKRVVVIGSGATAVTLVPALAQQAGHVTMLQRSPSYIAVLSPTDPLGDFARAKLSAKMAYRVIRGRNLAYSMAFFQFCRRYPEAARRYLRRKIAEHLPADYPIERHFAPRYNPWDQRMCLVPDADLFKAISAGTASVVTDTIEAFTETGIRLGSGEVLEADIIVTATGLTLVPCGGIGLSVDGRAVELRDSFVYKGLMLSGVPNLAWCVGYTNASWTLRADLASRHVCRLINFMDRNGHDQVVPRVDAGEVQERPLLDLSSGYVARGVGQMPKQGTKAPWYLRQNYVLDLLTTRFAPIGNPALAFSRKRERGAELVAVAGGFAR
jgi:cation diffusion facilitator CzcD-associated flavoprotein CzcO